jgi:type II secretory ATPase GspE/PulE/Tfp pilus assembly ATPase PilB-like protein
MSNDARLDEEIATQRRAGVLQLQYTDTSQIKDKQLFRDILTNDELYKLRVIPLESYKGNLHFGITTTTSQQTIQQLQQRFTDVRTTFSIISDAGYREYMQLYDPPKQVIYKDIALTQAAQQQTAEVSQLLGQVRADDMLAYLVSQAHNLGASDIHIECQREDVRIRYRIDGVLHPIARLPYDKYRVLLGAIASAGNVSTSADEAQQGHIAQKVKMADESEVDVNVRLETVPTMNGIDVVMRLFNMDASRYTLDRLGLSDQERAVLDGIHERH